MTMPNVLQIPSHMTYAKALGPAHTAPEVASPTLRIADLLAQPQWDFDIVHLHSLELVTLDELIRLRQRTVAEGVRLVATIHDLVPNIEANVGDFLIKVAYIASEADHVFTLTPQAADQIAALAPRAGPAEAVPHGAAIAIDSIPAVPVSGDGGLAVFGAFRPYRELEILVRAWQRLGEERPKLRVLLRSVTWADQERDAALLDLLEETARTDPRLHLTVTNTMLGDDDLVDWLTGASALVLPYSHITHSGQLELARDIGLPVIAPDIASLHGQLTTGPRKDLPAVWFAPDTLTIDDFPTCLRHASELTLDTAHRSSATATEDQNQVRAVRLAERTEITERHADVYADLLTKTGERV
ncbi:hypothetical protein ACFVDI_05720 [Nocardioides sp. NPDC057767]|uniref:hypothetical protein n=1 Tax=unclassified Nocardioides TaxID=2615069 RepID=UPI00366D8864